MPRERLEGVVRTLNEKLPRRMRIAGLDDDPMGWTSSDDDDSDDNDDGEGDVGAAISRMSDAEMRRWVEELVGIRRVDPGNLSLSALDLGTRTLVGMDVSPPTLASSPAPSPRTRNIVWPIEDMVSSDMDTDTDGNDDAIDGVGLGVDAGLHGRADDLSEDAANLLAPSNAFTMCSRTYSHPRGRGNLAMPLAALKEENEPEEEHVGGEAVCSNVDEDGGRDEGEAGEAVHVAKRRRVLFSEDEHVSAASRRVPTAQGSRLLEDLDVSASPVFDWDADDDDLRGRSSTKPAIGASPNKQKRPANKLRRRPRSARVPERERVDSQPASVHSATRPVSFPPCHFSICSSRSRSSSYEAPLPHSPSPTTIPIPASTSDTTSERSCKPVEPRILRSPSAHADTHTQHTSPSVDPDHASSTMARSQSERVPRPTDIDATLVPSQPQSPTPSRSSSRTRSSWPRFGRTRTRESEECSLTAGTPPSITDGPLPSGDVDVSSRTSLSSFVAVPAQSQCQCQDQMRAASSGRDDTRHGALSSPTSAPTTCASIAPSTLTSPFSFLASTPRSRARSVSSSVVSRSRFENEHEHQQARENEQAASSRDSGLGNVDLGEGIVEGIWTALGKMEVDVASSSVECQ